MHGIADALLPVSSSTFVSFGARSHAISDGDAVRDALQMDSATTLLKPSIFKLREHVVGNKFLTVCGALPVALEGSDRTPRGVCAALRWAVLSWAAVRTLDNKELADGIRAAAGALRQARADEQSNAAAHVRLPHAFPPSSVKGCVDLDQGDAHARSYEPKAALGWCANPAGAAFERWKAKGGRQESDDGNWTAALANQPATKRYLSYHLAPACAQSCNSTPPGLAAATAPGPEPHHLRLI